MIGENERKRDDVYIKMKGLMAEYLRLAERSDSIEEPEEHLIDMAKLAAQTVTAEGSDAFLPDGEFAEDETFVPTDFLEEMIRSGVDSLEEKLEKTQLEERAAREHRRSRDRMHIATEIMKVLMLNRSGEALARNPASDAVWAADQLLSELER